MATGSRIAARTPIAAKAAEGRQLRQLEPHPDTAPVVRRIFAEYIAGAGYYAIAEGLTRDGIKSPSAHDPGRNSHRCGVAWAKSAVRAIITNPRYTGRQVWNKQRKDEVLLDVEDVGLGHVTKMRWNEPGSWVWSSEVTHEPLIDVATFERAQQIFAAAGRGRARQLINVPRSYVLRGLVFCGVCQRRMQGQWNHGHAHYRCRFPDEYALANKVAHPLNVYLPEREVLPPLDEWLMLAFAPHRLAESIEAMYDAQPADDRDSARASARGVVAECDRKIARYREALDAGADPVLVTGWIAEVQARRAEAEAQLSGASRASGRMSREQIRSLVETISSVRGLLARAEPADKAKVYKQLGLRLTYQPGPRIVRVETTLDSVGQGFVSEGGVVH
jgi:site-specific DNA recombinase